MSSHLTNYTYCCGEGEEYHARVRHEGDIRDLREKLMLAQEEGNETKIAYYEREIQQAESKDTQLVYMQVAGLVCFCLIPATFVVVVLLSSS